MKNFHYHGMKDFTRIHIYYIKESLFYKVGLIKVKVLQNMKLPHEFILMYGTLKKYVQNTYKLIASYLPMYHCPPCHKPPLQPPSLRKHSPTSYQNHTCSEKRHSKF